MAKKTKMKKKKKKKKKGTTMLLLCMFCFHLSMVSSTREGKFAFRARSQSLPIGLNVPLAVLLGVLPFSTKLHH
jgi:hypothetical protein